MNRSVPVILTNMCMVYDGDKILVQDRVDADWSGLAFPGGHVEHEESFVESTIREIYEETGLTIQNPVLCGIKQWPTEDNGVYVVLLFKTNQFSGQLHASSEGNVFWIERSELGNYKLAVDFEEMLQIFDDEHISEFYYRRVPDGWKKEIF